MIGISDMKVILILGLVVLCLFAALVSFYIFEENAAKRELQELKPWISYTRLIYIGDGCDRYKATYGSWPASMDQLLKEEPQLSDPWDKDAWENELVIVPYERSRGYGEVISYGRDGKPGGRGDDHDLEVRFPMSANAVWNDQEGKGLREPRYHQ